MAAPRATCVLLLAMNACGGLLFVEGEASEVCHEGAPIVVQPAPGLGGQLRAMSELVIALPDALPPLGANAETSIRLRTLDLEVPAGHDLGFVDRATLSLKQPQGSAAKVVDLLTYRRTVDRPQRLTLSGTAAPDVGPLLEGGAVRTTVMLEGRPPGLPLSIATRTCAEVTVRVTYGR